MLPEAYLYGAAYTLAHRQRSAFLNGDYSSRGFPQFFPYGVLVKTPLALFGLLGLAALWLLRKGQSIGQGAVGQGYQAWLPLTPLFALLIVYWLAAIGSTLNIGHRHMLPTYPAMFILAGGAAGWLKGPHPKAMRWLVSLLLLAFAVESSAAPPHYLAYFNLLIPRERAYRHLVDSSLDWGQDLPALKTWLDEHSVALADQRVYLAYFGRSRPAAYGIQAVLLDSEQAYPLRGGVYCISATELQAVLRPMPGRWNVVYEQKYQAVRQYLAGGQLQAPIESRDPEALALLQSYRRLQAARLLAFLRQREPDDQVAYSLLIYRLSDDDVRQALEGPPAELDALSWFQREGITPEQP
jgi:hypothetical protein